MKSIEYFTKNESYIFSYMSEAAIIGAMGTLLKHSIVPEPDSDSVIEFSVTESGAAVVEYKAHTITAVEVYVNGIEFPGTAPYRGVSVDETIKEALPEVKDTDIDRISIITEKRSYNLDVVICAWYVSAGSYSAGYHRGNVDKLIRTFVNAIHYARSIGKLRVVPLDNV